MSPLTPEHCRALDAADPLRDFRARFSLPPDLIYLDGNSLGVLPAQTPARLQQLMAQEWGNGLVRSWNAAGWVDLPQRLGDKIGTLIGAAPGQTVAADSTSLNLYKALAMALQLRPGRRVIVCEEGDFPTDQYIAQGLIAQLGAAHELRRVPAAQLAAALNEDCALLMLSHVNYRTGELHDMAALTARAHAVGALTLWDLAHSAGALPVTLDAAQADFAVGCGYKYLNGGPGAPAFLYVAQRWQAQVQSPLSGWFGHARPFAFEPDYAPAAGITRTLAGTPPILSMAALEVGVDLMREASMQAIRSKSLRLTQDFIALADAHLASHGISVASPREPERRGSQVCLRHPQAWPIMQALIARGVIGDFRAPDLLRFGFTPLYTTHAEVWQAVEILRQLMQSGAWDQPQFHARKVVT